MITPEDDDGVVGETEFVQRLQQAADLCVDVADTGVVAVDQLAGPLVIERFLQAVQLRSPYCDASDRLPAAELLVDAYAE